MIKIEITEQKISFEKSGTNAGGRAYHIRKQLGFMHVPNQKYPRQFSFGLPDSAVGPYPAGFYEISDESFYVESKFNNLVLSQNLILIPLK